MVDGNDHRQYQTANDEIDDACSAPAQAADEKARIVAFEKPIPVKGRSKDCQQSGCDENGGNKPQTFRHRCHASGNVMDSVRDPSSFSTMSTRTVSAGSNSSILSGHSTKQMAPESK